jgi:hypothetical protein
LPSLLSAHPRRRHMPEMPPVQRMPSMEQMPTKWNLRASGHLKSAQKWSSAILKGHGVQPRSWAIAAAWPSTTNPNKLGGIANVQFSPIDFQASARSILRLIKLRSARQAKGSLNFLPDRICGAKHQALWEAIRNPFRMARKPGLGPRPSASKRPPCTTRVERITTWER